MRTFRRRSLPCRIASLKLNIPAFAVELIGNPVEELFWEHRRGLEDRGFDFPRIQHHYVGFSLSGYPPAGECKNRFDSYWFADRLAQLSAESIRLLFRLIQWFRSNAAWRAKRFALEHDFISRLPLGRFFLRRVLVSIA